MRLVVWLALLAIGACEPLSILGVEERVSEKSNLQEPPPLADDRIEDKFPVYDRTAVIEEEIDGCLVRWNKSASVTKLDILPFDDSSRDLEQRVFSGWSSAAKALAGKRLLPSMEMVQGKLKPFNDGLYAAVELDAERGEGGSSINKSAVFRDVLAALVARGNDEAAASFAGALKLAGESPTAPPSVLSRADSLISTFEGRPLASRPMGFYSWTPALSAVFRRDRFLQGWWGSGSFAGTAQTALVLRDDVALRARYGSILDLYAGMTGRYNDVSPIAIAKLVDGGAPTALSGLETATLASHPGLAATGACAASYAMLPRSETAESKLFRTLFCERRVPEGTNLFDVLIAQIRSGALDLSPKADAGWSDHQLYALETLLVPERAPEKDHLFLTRRYKEKLIETFKTLVTQNRETHAKQVEISFGGSSSSASVPARPVDLHPNLSVEPFATFYLRTARAYRFVHNVLRATMGEAWLSGARRVIENGAAAALTLEDELLGIEELLYGLHVTAARSIGMKPQLGSDDPPMSEAMSKRAAAFLGTLADDPDIARDPRVIVPIMLDVERNEVRYWAVIGARVMRVRAEFYPGFEPRDVAVGGGCYFRSYVPQEPYLLVGKTIELALPANRPPPTREEFRRACDASADPEAIRAALTR